MKNFALLFFVICLLFTNCTTNVKKVEIETEDGGVKIINIMDNFSENRKINLSAVASNIEYCILETDEKCLVTPSMNIHCIQDYIIAIGYQTTRDACYVFDRNTGAFIREISKLGQGPNEYTEIIDVFLYGDTILIGAWNGKEHLFFNIDGTLSHKINRTNPIITRTIMYKNFHVNYHISSVERITPRIYFIDKTGEYVDSIPEYRAQGMSKHPNSPYGGAWLYTFRDNLYYKDRFCDTLYHVKDFALHPRYIFNTGSLSPPYKIQQELGSRYDLIAGIADGTGIAPDRYEKYVLIEKILEESKHLYFTIEYRQQIYPALYDKTEDRLQVISPIPIPPRIGRNWNIPLYGLENNIDGGLPFWPMRMISNKEMMCVYTAEELLKLNASTIVDEKLKNVLNSLEEDSNPVVAIVSLKD